MKHESVLLKESIEGLAIQPTGVYVDGTLGRGGHSLEIIQKLTSGHLYMFDKDQQAIVESRERLKDYLSNATFIRGDFRKMKELLQEYGVTSVDGILLDLGVSSPQLDDGERGFSYRYDARLDMRMDQSQTLTAYEIVNHYDYHQLVKILFEYGEEKNAKQIARAIEKQRAISPIETTFQLVDCIKSALPQKILNKKGHPAKQTFQAIRIAVNDELKGLEEVLIDGISLLNPNGRFCVITFHSLEDRIVKRAFEKVTKAEVVDKRIPLRSNEIEEKEYELVNKKPILASEEELEENNRSHSAKLRILRKKGE